MSKAAADMYASQAALGEQPPVKPVVQQAYISLGASVARRWLTTVLQLTNSTVDAIERHTGLTGGTGS